MRRPILIPALAALLTFALTGTAGAQYESRALYDRIDRLERDLQMMQGQVMRQGGGMVITSPSAGGSAPMRGPVEPAAPLPQGMAARLDDRVDQLEELVRQLTGRVEEANFKAAQAMKQMERMQADIDLRFKDLQAAGTQAPAAPAGDKVSLNPPRGADAPGPAPGPQTLGSMPEKDLKKAATPPAPAKALDPQEQYDAAYAAAQAGDYANAQKAFQDFLAKNGAHPLAGNASYWLGDIAYAQKDFGTAAATFLEAYKKYPKHGKAPDMIYKAGSAFGQMDKKKEACTAFTILFNDHPKMPDRVKRAATAEKQKYGCK